MDLNQYYNMPEGANMDLKYSSFFDSVEDDYPLPSNAKNLFSYQLRQVIKPLNFSNVKRANNMFHGCNLKFWDNVEDLDVSNINEMDSMFYSSKFTKVFSRKWDTSKVTYMPNMFNNNSDLEEFDVNWDTSKVTNFSNCINSTKLRKISALDCGSLSAKNNYPLRYYSDQTVLTDVGGFLNMKMSWDDNYSLSKCPNLTYQSCINILNGLYDFTGNGEVPNSNQGTLKVHQNFLNLVGDEIAIGINKGWKITA